MVKKDDFQLMMYVFGAWICVVLFVCFYRLLDSLEFGDNICFPGNCFSKHRGLKMRIQLSP